MRLHEIVAVAKGAKTRGDKDLNNAYQALQNTKPYVGIKRSYQPRDQEGENLPSEANKVQLTVAQVLAEAQSAFNGIIDVIATQDAGNQAASADIVIDGIAIAENVPATTLIFLEKKAVEMGNVINKIQTLSVDRDWNPVGDGTYKTSVVTTTRTKKVPKNHVVSPSTTNHPAQVQVFNEDIVIGDWDTVNLSGAIPPSEKRALETRQRKLIDAIKVARTQANSTEVSNVKLGANLTNYLFGQPE